MMKCFECDNGNVERREILVTKELKGEHLEFPATVDVCDSCACWEIPLEEANRFGKALDTAYRAKAGLLCRDQIREFRERLGMNQEQFAAYLGVGPASVKRWELGAIQDKSSDELIRLKCDPGHAMQHAQALARRLGVSDTVPHQHTTTYVLVNRVPQFLQDWTEGRRHAVRRPGRKR